MASFLVAHLYVLFVTQQFLVTYYLSRCRYMKKIVFIAVLLFSSCFSFSQKISNVDFDAVKKKLDTDPGLYKQLLDRFIQSDSTLTNEDYYLIYYGQCFQPSYDPNSV